MEIWKVRKLAAQPWTPKRVARLGARIAAIGRQRSRDIEDQKLFPDEELRLLNYAGLTASIARLQPELRGHLRPLQERLDQILEQFIPEDRQKEFRRSIRSGVRKVLDRVPKEKASAPQPARRRRRSQRKVEPVERLEAREDRLLRLLAKALVKRRKVCDFSQVELAERARISPSFLCEIEKGDANPTWETLARLCAELEITLPELILEATLPRERLTPEQRTAMDLLCDLLVQPQETIFSGSKNLSRK